MPRPEIPRQDETPEPSIKMPTPAAQTTENKSVETPPLEEPKAAEKKKPKFGWAGRILGSD